ncbi:MAG: hypothetical protein WBC18_27710 [Ottowia sp.]|uniref:hypothetical protein n=1 Tax=Ottowia sp. TaxID=1898956 RepID=UPI003C709877
MNKRVTSLLLGLNVLFAVALALLWFGPGRSTRWTPPAAQPPNLNDARAALLGPRPDISAEFPQIAARPLLSSSRRPLPAASAAVDSEAPPPPMALDKLKMLGTIDGPTLRGVLAEVEGESRLIRSGEQIGEWTLRDIDSSQATFEKGGEKRVLPLPLAGSGDSGKEAAGRARAVPPRAGKPVARPASPQSRPPPPPPPKPAPAPARPTAKPSDPPAGKASGPIGSWGP